MTEAAQRTLRPGMVEYPIGVLAARDQDRPPALACRGPTDLLHLPLAGFLSSADVPADLVLPALDLARKLRAHGTALCGGFQGPLERACLDILVRGNQPLVVSPARSLDGLSLTAALRARLAAGNLLLISAAPEGFRRPTSRLAMRRNELVLALTKELVVVSAGAGSRAMRFATEALEEGKKVSCFDHRRNRDLLLLGAKPLHPGRWVAQHWNAPR